MSVSIIAKIIVLSARVGAHGRHNTMQHSISSVVKDKTAITVGQSALIQIFAALVLGVALIYGVGFASVDVAHNATHDTRHAVAFPCH